MTVYVLEVGGEIVAAVFTRSRDRAAELMLGPGFRALLRTARRPSGSPVWDGQSRLFLRDADETEADRALAARAGLAQDATGPHVLMRVPIEPLAEPAGDAAGP